MENTIEKPLKQRIFLLKIPIDVISPENLEAEIMNILSSEEPKQIVLLSLWDFLRGRRNGEYRNLLKSASLVIPTSKSLIRGAVFLGKPKPYRYNPFSFIIKVLGILEKYNKSVYFFGTRKQSLLTAENNVKKTFPRIRSVGRFTGFYPKSIENDIILGIQKSAPSFVLVSDGVPGGEKWIYKHRRQFTKSIFLLSSSILDIFAEIKKRISDSLFDKGLEVLPQILKNPLKIFFIFRYLWYNILLVVYRIFRLG